MLTHDEHTLTVCTEDTLAAIQDRFALVNAHAKGYIWKRLGIILDMAQGLVPDLIQDANGIPDETSEFERVGMDADLYLPAIHLYFSDDLTVC